MTVNKTEGQTPKSPKKEPNIFHIDKHEIKLKKQYK